MSKYEKELAIDPHALDEEWVEQPRKFFKYAEALADARRDLDRAKERLDIKRAQLDLEIRQDPTKFGLDGKVTEAAIANAILLDDDLKKMREELHDASHTVEVLNAAVRAFDQRKSALENLVRLHGQQYYSTPDAGAMPAVAREAMQEAERADIREGMKRRRTT